MQHDTLAFLFIEFDFSTLESVVQKNPSSKDNLSQYRLSTRTHTLWKHILYLEFDNNTFSLKQVHKELRGPIKTQHPHMHIDMD